MGDYDYLFKNNPLDEIYPSIGTQPHKIHSPIPLQNRTENHFSNLPMNLANTNTSRNQTPVHFNNQLNPPELNFNQSKTTVHFNNQLEHSEMNFNQSQTPDMSFNQSGEVINFSAALDSSIADLDLSLDKLDLSDPSVLLSTILQQPHNLNTDLTTQDLTGGMSDLNVGGIPD